MKALRQILLFVLLYGNGLASVQSQDWPTDITYPADFPQGISLNASSLGSVGVVFGGLGSGHDPFTATFTNGAGDTIEYRSQIGMVINPGGIRTTYLTSLRISRKNTVDGLKSTSMKGVVGGRVEVDMDNGVGTELISSHYNSNIADFIVKPVMLSNGNLFPEAEPTMQTLKGTKTYTYTQGIGATIVFESLAAQMPTQDNMGIVNRSEKFRILFQDHFFSSSWSLHREGTTVIETSPGNFSTDNLGPIDDADIWPNSSGSGGVGTSNFLHNFTLTHVFDLSFLNQNPMQTAMEANSDMPLVQTLPNYLWP